MIGPSQFLSSRVAWKSVTKRSPWWVWKDITIYQSKWASQRGWLASGMTQLLLYVWHFFIIFHFSMLSLWLNKKHSSRARRQLFFLISLLLCSSRHFQYTKRWKVCRAWNLWLIVFSMGTQSNSTRRMNPQRRISGGKCYKAEGC